MLYVLPLTSQVGVLQVAWVLNSDWMKYTREPLHTRELDHLLQIKFALGR